MCNTSDDRLAVYFDCCCFILGQSPFDIVTVALIHGPISSCKFCITPKYNQPDHQVFEIDCYLDHQNLKTKSSIWLQHGQHWLHVLIKKQFISSFPSYSYVPPKPLKFHSYQLPSYFPNSSSVSLKP